MSPSNVTIRGGEFIENSCLQKGGVWFGSDGDSFFVVEGGVFRGNTGGAGGVGYVDTYADARINGGIYEANQAEHGGVFFVGADAKFEVRGTLLRVARVISFFSLFFISAHYRKTFRLSRFIQAIWGWGVPHPAGV